MGAVYKDFLQVTIMATAKFFMYYLRQMDPSRAVMSDVKYVCHSIHWNY